MKSAPLFLGGDGADSLLERARCYALLGQRKTAIFDFSAILKEHPKHVQALCGRGFTYLMLNQQQVLTSMASKQAHVTNCVAFRNRGKTNTSLVDYVATSIALLCYEL